MPDRCPFCLCHDVRPLFDTAFEPVGYRCHDCARTFYVTDQSAPERLTGKRQQAATTQTADRPRQLSRVT